MKKLFATISIILGIFASTPATLAAVQLDPTLHPEFAPIVVLDGGNEADYGNYFLQLIAGGLLYLAGPVAILVIAIAGLRYVTSHGEQGAIDGAKNTLTWGIIGLVVVILAFAIVRIVITTVLTTGTANPGYKGDPYGSTQSASPPGGKTPISNPAPKPNP